MSAHSAGTELELSPSEEQGHYALHGFLHCEILWPNVWASPALDSICGVPRLS